MTKLEGIEDASYVPHRVWFSKGKKESDPWTPLRICDCIALNQSIQEGKGEGKVIIESGRATADISNLVIHYNFYNSLTRALGSAIWFQKVSSKSEKDDRSNLIPIISVQDENLIESFYQEGLTNCGSLGQGIGNFLKKEVDLIDDYSHKICMAKAGVDSVVIRKKSKNFMSLEGFVDLQRGYGNYTVDGEEEELALGPVRHLSFIIHGIGEAMWSRDDVNTLSSIDEVNLLRSNINKKMYMEWKQECQRCQKANDRKRLKLATIPIPPPPHRIEFIPVEWYHQIHSSSSALKTDLVSTTLTTVPKLRNIANDVLFDVLVYNTPEFCGKVLECVTNQICDLHLKFQVVHTDFLDNGGTFSLVGHSLGSVIAWDMLSILSDNLKFKHESHNVGKGTKDDPIVTSDIVSTLSSSMIGYALPSSSTMSSDSSQNQKQKHNPSNEPSQSSNIEEVNVGSWGPSLLKRMTKTIPFIPSFTFFLGSPIGLFLTLRGARPLFHDMLLSQDTLRQKKNRHDNKTKSSSNSEDVNINTDGDGGNGGNDDNNDDDDDDDEDAMHPISPFHLPSGSLYNIFSPSDPVAYRIEPLLLPPNYPISDTPPPCFLVPSGQSVRFHLKAKEIGDTLMKSFSGLFKSTLEKIPDASSSSLASKNVTTTTTTTTMTTAMTHGSDRPMLQRKKPRKASNRPAPEWDFPLGSGGNEYSRGHGSNRRNNTIEVTNSNKKKNQRVDYQLQPGVVENEYLAAISAHGSYMVNDDLLEFWIQCTHEN
mmetsp:Transcript_20839/g.24127  ORF Transcript_20839/g.24127 Transcript_20839/m.24127 type:complete len:763 (-) Transcript_20839:49-2337(-)